MSLRVELTTVNGAKDDSFAPCAFAAGKVAEAPSCSSKLMLATCLDRFEREAVKAEYDTGRYRMPYWVWGRGPALVLIPGLCDDARSFVLPLARLSGHFCCIIYDLPTGTSDGARLAGYRHDDLVTDLLNLCDHLRLDSAGLMGISFGSTIALAAMAREPRRFRATVLQGGFARRPLAWTEVLLARWARYWPGTLRRLPAWRHVLERYHSPEFAGCEPGRWTYFLDHHGAAPNSAVAYRSLLLHQTDLRPLLPRITQPVLLVCGERDRLVGRECEDALLRGLPNVGRAEIEGCGHLPQFTHPEVLCEVVTQFLSPRDDPHEERQEPRTK